MQTNATHYVDGADKVEGFILEVGPEKARTMYLNVGEGSSRTTFIISDTMFLDRLANEAERLCREFVGDVPAPVEAPEEISA